MSWVTSRPGGGGGRGTDMSSVPPDLDEITDEEFLKQLWQQAEDFSDRRRIRARMYKLREKRLREMVQNDEESLGALTMTDEGDSSYHTETHTSAAQTTERKSSVEIKLDYKGDSSVSESSRIGQLSMRGVGTTKDDDIIENRIKEVSKGRGARYQQVLNKYDEQNENSTSRSNYSVQSNALTGDSYQSIKHKEVRDSVSPVRGAFDRRIIGEESETTFTSDEEVAIKSESESVSSRNTSRDDKSVKSTTSSRKVTERKLSKELNINTSKKAEKSSPTSPSRKVPGDTSPSKATTKRQAATPGENQSSILTKVKTDKRTNQSTSANRLSSGRKKVNEKSTKMGKEINGDYKNLHDYLNENVDSDDEIIKEEEEEGEDEEGHTVKMIVQTRKKKDGTQIISRRLARAMKIVEKESDIDEILVGNPDHEVLERNVEEKEEKDGSKIKIITETRRRPDGIEYTTKNVLKTSKIFDYDHPEDIAYSEHDELISSEESTETDENGITIKTVTETRRKKDGVEYTTKKVYKTFKVDATITPSDDDEVLDRKETDEEQSDGTILRIIIEKRRTKDGQEYTHRQVYRSRKLTLSGIDVLKGTPSVDNDDEVIDRKEKEELDENRTKIKIVTETRRRKDGSTYSFEYILRSFKGTENDIEKMSIEAASNSSNINVSDNDKIIKEDVKEELQKDGSIVRTIIERRRAKDGTEYLRHRIMKIPKLPEPELVVGSLDDEVIEEDVKEKVLADGTHCKAITERRRSSTTGVHYTLRRMSKVFHHQSHLAQTDEIIDENVTEEETGNGILVKTVIRRYERPDGSVYTTHDIQKSYNSPVAVNVDEYEYDELIDRSYDERETLDGYIIKTIIETRCRNDGTHYTIERTEKVSKLGEGIEVSFKGNSISSGSPGDTVVSCEEHEEPSDDGALVKTILEVRRRPDGTEYTNKITIRSTEVLVPEHETSYVIIKADSKDGDGECSFFPSLEDEIVYVRKKQDVDEKGNQITIVIETRKSKTTGEKYNLTKKIHTTDVVMTDKGEKILTKKPQREGTLTRKRKSIEKVDTKKTNRISSFEKDKSKVVPSSVTVNLVTKKATVKEATKSSPLKPTTVRKSPKSGSESEPSMSNSIKKPIKRYPSGDNKIQERSNRKPVQDAKKTSSYTIKQKVTQSNSLPVTKSKVVRKPLPTKKYGSPSDSSPEQISENDSSGKESPRRESKPRSEPSPKVKSPVTRVSSSPARGRSPHRSGTSTPREGTPVRQCCKKSEPETPSPKQKSYVPIVRKKPESKDAPNVNGDLKKQPRKIQPDNSFKFEKSPPRDSPTKSQRPRSPEKSYTSKVLPEKSYKDSNTFKKPVESKKASPPNELSFEKEPIISLPQTPLTEEMKAYPATSSSTPYIEDVSTEPDLPYHTVHRPSLVREPSEYNPDILNDESLDTSAPKATKTREPKSSFETKIDKKSSDSSAYSSSEDESRRFPSKRKDSPFKPFPTTSKKPFSEERKPKPIIEKTREEAPKSLLDQIIPDGSEETSDIETDREKKIEMKNSFSAKLSMFERSKPDAKEIKTSYKPEKKQPQTEKLVPVKEPIIVPKYIHPLGSDSESDQDKPKKTTKEDINLSSTRLVMSAIGSENLQSKTTREYESTDREKQDIVTSLRERSKSPFSKDSSSLPRSKEGSPAPFVKEDSPGRFLTGKPIDQGPNTTKIKRLERSNSNKKIIYEDLEENAANLPSYLKDIEYITDVSVLEKLLQKAETYEERRIIRGHIRSLKKVDSNLTKTSTPNYKRFIESKPSPTSSPILSRRTTTTETTSYTKSGPSKKPDPKGDTRSPQLSPTEESKSFRSFQSKDRRYKKRSTDESESDRRSSVEEIKYERKSSSEIIERSEVTSSLTDRSREWKYKPTETTVKRSTELFSTTKVRKESPEGRIPSDRTSSPEDSKRVTSSSLYSDKYRKLSDDISKGRKISDDDLTRKTSRDNTVRKISSEETTRKKSREETTRKTSTEILRKTSHEETIRRSSRDDTIRKTSRDDTVKKSPRDDTFRKTTRDVTTRKTSQDDTVRKTSRTDKERKSSQDDTTKKITNKFSREPKTRETPKDTSREYPRKSSREDSYRKSSPESYERNRTSSPDTPKSSRKSSPDTKVIRRTSPDRKLKEVVPKSDTRQPKPYETSVTRKTSDDLETSVKSTSYLSKSDTRSDSVSKRYTKTSAELDINRQPQETKEKPDTKPVSRSPFLTRKQKETPKETTESHVYMEPLRHQRLGTTVKSKVEQTNVDKIVSPYGVGPTDEYGLPLIGLKALKRRNQQPTEEPVAPKPEKPEEEFVPCDAQGRPLFGLRALRKAPETTTFTTTQVAKESTAVQETLHNAFVSTETSHLQSGVITQPETHTTEVVSTTIKNETTTTGPLEESCPTYSSSDDSHQHNTVERRQKRTRRKDLSSFGGSAANPVSSEDEENLKDHSNKTRRVTNRFLKRDLSSELSSESEGIRALSTPGETSPSLVKSVDMSLRRKPSLTGSDSEKEKTVSLRDIIKLHEAKVVSEQTEPKDSASTPLKPKKKLRDTFEPTSEQVTDSRPHRTWDLETDLSTRSQVMENIIAKHETLTKQETPKPAKKLNGILKKTSTSSIQTSKIISSDSEGFESSERTEIFERKSSKDRSPSPSKVEDRDEFRKDKTNDVERKTSYTEIRLSKPTEDGDESKPLRIIKGQKSAEVKIFATERKDKTDKTDERPERRKTSDTISKTTTRKENVTGEPKKTVHKKSISEEKPLISPGDKLPAISNDLFKVDDRKGKITSNETKLSTTEKLEEKTQRKPKSVIDTTKDKKSPQIIKERDVSPKVGKKEPKTKPLGDSIEKDSIDGDSSSESSSDESSSSQSSVDSQRKIKPSKPTKSPSDKKDSLERKKVPKKPKDSRREERHSTTRKKSNKETELVIEDAVSRDFSSSSSPERSTTRRVQKPSYKSLRDDKDHETARTTSRSVVKTHSQKEELSDRERKKSYDKLVKATSKTEDTRNLFTENRRKSSETKPSKFVSPERENKVHKKSKTPEPVPTDLHVKKLPTTDKPSRKTTLIEKHIFNDDSKQRIDTYKRKTYNEDKKVFGSPKKETHVSRNRIDSKKSVNANLKDSPEVVRDKTRLSPKYKKAKISDIKESDKKFTRKEYDSNLREFKKSPRDKPKVKEFSVTEKTVKVRKEEGKHFDKDREIKRKSSTTEHSKAKRKLSKEFHDVKSDDTEETKDKTTPFTKSSPLKPRTKGKELAPKIKTYETDKLSGKENITKKVTNETLNIRKSTVKNDKRNLETSDLGFTREKISSLKERKDDSETKGAKFSSKSIDQSKIKDSSDSSESETVKERVKTVNKYSSDEEYASKRKSSVSSTSEEKIKTYKTDSDQCINEVSKFADIKKEELQKRRIDRTESEKKIEMNKIRKETDILEVSEIEDKTQLKPKRSIDLISETKVTKKSYDTETNLVSKSKTVDDEDIIQVKKPKGQESRPQIIPEKRTEVPLDEREKDKVSKSPELDKTRTQVKPHKTTDSYNRDVVKTTKEEISRHSNKQDKKRESIISDVQESKTKPKQNIRGDEKVVDKDELKMTVDSDVEIKTTSDSDMSVDAKKIYKKKTEISDKVSDNEKVDKQSDIKRTEKSKVNYQTIRDAKLATKHTENEDVKEEKVRKTSQNIKTTRVLEKDKEFLKDETELYKEVRPKKYNDVFCTVDGRIIDKSPLPDKGTPKIRPDPKQKTKSDQKQVDEDELNINIKTDFDIEIKTTSDSDVSADTKQLYKKETEISGKKSDIGKIDKQSDVKRTEKLRVSSQTMIEDKTASKISEIKDENEEKVRKTSQNIKTSTVSEVKNKFLKDETDIDKKAKPKKSLEKKDVFCTVDGRIIDKQPLPAKGTPKLRPDSEQDTKNDQTQIENDRLHIRDDIDVEIKTTSDTDVSVDTKHIYKTEIETSDKERDIGKVDKTEKSKVSSQTIIEENTATKFSENKNVKEEKVRKTSQNIKTSRVSEKKKEPLQDETDVSKKVRTRKSVEKNHLFCTVDGRIIDKQSVPAKETPKIRSDTDVSRRKKSSPSSENIPHDTNKIDTKKESKHQIASKVPKNSPVSRLSKSPEPEDISRRLRKLSKQRKTSAENIDDSNKRKNSDSRTCSLQSLSVASTTSSVPGYMRPRRDSKSYKRHTPERDLQEVEDLLLNSYQYTRCTKRVVKPPVKYDYTYVINTNEGAAGGKDSYSIYFGPREKVPLLKNNAPETIVYGDTHVRHSRDESNASSRKTSIDTVASSQKNVQEIVTESDRVSSDKKSDEDKYLDIKLQYENKIKAIDLKHSSPRDDSPPYQRKESDSRYNEDIHKNFENKGTFSDIRQQYKDTVRSIAEDSFRKSSYTSESKSKEHIEHSKPDIEDPSLLKYKELASKDYKDYGIEKKQQSTLYSVTDLRNLSKKDNLVTSSSYDNRDVQGLQTEVQTKVVEDDQRSRDSSTVIRDKTSALSESKEFEKQSRESHVKESLSTGNDTINFDRTTTLKNIKFLPDYDYNKIYASKTSKPSTDSQQVFSSDEQYSNSKDNVSQTMKTDSSTYVTFDGRTVTTSDRKAFDKSDSTSAFNKMADDKHGKVGQSDLRSSQFVQQDDNIQKESMNKKSSSTSVALDSNTTSSTTVQAINRTDTSDVSGRSFLDDRSKVTGISDVLSRMGASEAVDHEAKITSDDQARSLLNKFLGAQVLMTGVESMMANSSSAKTSSQTSMTRNTDGNVAVTRNVSGEHVTKSFKDGDVVENRKTFSTGPQTISYNVSSSSPKAVVESSDIVKGVNINEVTDDFALNQLLDSCEEYDERRRVRLRLKELMVEKKALQKQLSGHERSDVYSSSRRTAGVSGSKGSDLQTSEGELESLILKKLRSSLRQGKETSNYNNNNNNNDYYAFTPNGENNAYSSKSLSYKESVGVPSSKNTDTKLFLNSVKNNLKKYIMEKSDSSENKSSEDLSSEFIVEVSSVLDKLKNKITKSKSQIVVPDISETPEESEQLIGLIDKLKTSLSTVVESEGSLARENGKTKERDDSNSPYEHLDADDEDDSDMEDDLDTDDEECDTETVETVQTAILRSSENGLKNETKKRKEMEVEQRAKGIEDSLSSSGDDEIKYQENRSLSNSSDSKHQLQRQPSREEARSYLSSAIVKCKSREEMVKQGSDDYSDGKTEVETSERFESSPETDAKEKENAKKKDLKDLPWKIRAAKKRSQDQSQRHSVSGSSSPSFVPLALRRNSFEAVSNSKPRPFVAGTPIQSKSFGDVVQAITDEPANYESFSATQPVLNGNSAQPNDHEDLTSQKQTDDSEESGEDEEGQVFSIKSSEHESVLRKELPGIYHNQFKASINKPFNLLSKVNKKEVLKKSEMFKNPTTDDISSELKDSISLDGISHDISKSVPESNILDIYHNEQKSHLSKPVNLLQKLDKKEVRKKSELFSKASEEKNKRNHHHLPFVRNRSEEKYTNQNPLPRHSFQPLSNVPFSNIPPIDSMKFDLPFLSKRPTTLHLRTKVPDCRPVEFSDFIIDNHCPPIPTKGEVLTPPTVPKKSLNTSHNFQNRLTTSKSQEKINIPDDQVYKNTNMPFSLSRSKSSPIVIKESFLDNSLTSNLNQKINNLNLENKREKLQNALNKSDDSNLKPIFTYSDKTVKTNKVSEIQNKFESSSQNSYGLSQSLDQSRLNTSESDKNVNKDPSSLLFTEEQLVKIAIHKAAINKQLYEGENNRKIGFGRTKSVSEQNTNKSAAPFRRVNSIAGSEFLANSSHLREGHIEETKNYYNHESTMEQRHLQEQRQHQQKQQGKPKLQPAEKLNEDEQHNRNVEKLQTEQQSLVHAQKGQYKLQENKNEIPITEHQLLEMQNRKEHDLLQKNLEKQKLEQIRLEEQKVEHERLKKQALEREKIEQHKREQQFERQRIEQERIEQQKKEQERIEQQKKEQERIEQQKKEQKRSEMLLKQQQLYEQQRKDQEQKILNQKISFVPGSNREAKRIQQMFEDQSKQESQEPIRTERSGRSQTKDTDTHISDSGINAKSLQKYHHYRSLSTSGKLHKENESASTRGASLGRSQESLNSEEEVFYDALTSGNDVSSIGGKRNLNSSQESTSKPVMQMMRGHVFSSSLPETSKKLSQTPEMTRKVYKPNVHRTNSLIEKSIRKISLQNDTKDEGLNEQSSFSFRNKSSSVSALSDNQGSSYSSHSIQDIKLKNKPDFVVPPLPKTNFKQQKYEQQISQVKKNAQQYSNANIRNEKRQTSEFKLENDSSNIKSKFTNYYVPPLPTTDFKRINDSKAERTKAFSVRTQSLSSLPPDTVGNANTGVLDTIKEKESEEFLANQGKVASKWENAISSSEKVATSGKPWTKGAVTEFQGQYVQRSKELLLKDKNTDSNNVDTKQPKGVFQQLKQSKSTFAAYKKKKMFKEKVKKWEPNAEESSASEPKNQWEKVGENLYVNTRLKNKKIWEKVAENTYRRVSKDQNKSKVAKWDISGQGKEISNKNIKDTKKHETKSKPQIDKKWEKKWESFIENSTSNVQNSSFHSKPNLNNKNNVVLRIKENKFENSKSESHPDVENKVNVKRLSKDIIQVFADTDKTDCTTKQAGFTEHVKRIDKTNVEKVFGVADDVILTLRKPENLTTKEKIKRECSKFESGMVSNANTFSSGSEIKRSRSGIIKSSIAAFEDGVSISHAPKHITKTSPGTLAVKRNLEMFEKTMQNINNDERDVRRPNPLRSSKSAVFSKGIALFNSDSTPEIKKSEKRRSAAEKYSHKFASLLEQLESPVEDTNLTYSNDLSKSVHKLPKNIEFLSYESQPLTGSTSSKIIPWGNESPKRVPTSNTIRHGQFEPSLSKDKIEQKRKEMESFFSQSGSNKISEIYKLYKENETKPDNREIESQDQDETLESWERLLSDTDYNSSQVDEMFSKTLLRDINVNEKYSPMLDNKVKPHVNDLDSPLDVHEPVYSCVRVNKSKSFAEFNKSRLVSTQSNNTQFAANFLSNKLASVSTRSVSPAVGNNSRSSFLTPYNYEDDSEYSDSSSSSSDRESGNLGIVHDSDIHYFQNGTSNEYATRELIKPRKKPTPSFCTQNKQRNQNTSSQPSFNTLFMARHSEDRFSDGTLSYSEQSFESGNDHEWVDDDDIDHEQVDLSFRRYLTASSDNSIPAIEVTDLEPGLLSVPSGNVCPIQNETDSLNCNRLTVWDSSESLKSSDNDPKLIIIKNFFTND